MEDAATLTEAAGHWMDHLPRYPRPLIERAYPENRGLTPLTQVRATCPRCYTEYDGRTHSVCAHHHEPLALIVNPRCRYGGGHCPPGARCRASETMSPGPGCISTCWTAWALRSTTPKTWAW